MLLCAQARRSACARAAHCAAAMQGLHRAGWAVWHTTRRAFRRNPLQGALQPCATPALTPVPCSASRVRASAHTRASPLRPGRCTSACASRPGSKQPPAGDCGPPSGERPAGVQWEVGDLASHRCCPCQPQLQCMRAWGTFSSSQHGGHPPLCAGCCPRAPPARLAAARASTVSWLRVHGRLA